MNENHLTQSEGLQFIYRTIDILLKADRWTEINEIIKCITPKRENLHIGLALLIATKWVKEDREGKFPARQQLYENVKKVAIEISKDPEGIMIGLE